LNSQLQTATSLYGGKYLGPNEVMVRCPGHPDKTPSLKLKLGADGRLINHCFAGCDWQYIDGLLMSDGIQEPFKPGHTENPLERQKHKLRQAEAQKQRKIEELEQAKKATAAANQIWGGTVHV